MLDFVWTAGGRPKDIDSVTPEKGQSEMLGLATTGGESNLLGMFAGMGMAAYCGRVCRSLGYGRMIDQAAWKKCKTECKGRYKEVKSGQYKIAPYEEVSEEVIEVDVQDNGEEKRSKRGRVIGFAIVILIIVILAIVFLKKKK